MYLAFKHIHVTCVIISGLLFSYRFYRLQRYPDQSLHRALKIVPHVNDTVLLTAAIAMLVLIELNPLQVPWLLAKILLLALYIGLGAACFRAIPGSRRQAAFFLLAVSVYLSMVTAALIKYPNPIG